MDEGFGLNRFDGGAPGGGPGGSIDARTAFLVLGCLVLPAALFSLGHGIEVLDLVWCALSLRLRSL